MESLMQDHFHFDESVGSRFNLGSSVKRKMLATAAAVFVAVALPSVGLAQQKPPVKLALITATTGPLASYGKYQEFFVKLAVEDINAKGGINGSPLQLDIGDAQVDPGQAVLLFRKYANEGYFGVVGPMTGTQWETVSPLANQLSMPAISANAIKPGITVRPWTIRLQPPDDLVMADGIKAFLKAYPNVKRVAITADVREASSKAEAEIFAKLAKSHGLQVLDTLEFSSRATDLSPLAIQMKSLAPDAIFTAAFPAQAMLLAREFETQGLNVPVLNTSILWPGPFINNAGQTAKNWHVMGFSTNQAGMPGTTDDATYQSIVKRVFERADASMGTPPNVANWSIGYDAVLLFADIMRRTGIDGRTDVKKARELIKNEFLNVKSFKGAYVYSMQSTGDAYIPGTILMADPAKKQWVFHPKAR